MRCLHRQLSLPGLHSTGRALLYLTGNPRQRRATCSSRHLPEVVDRGLPDQRRRATAPMHGCTPPDGSRHPAELFLVVVGAHMVAILPGLVDGPHRTKRTHSTKRNKPTNRKDRLDGAPPVWGQNAHAACSLSFWRHTTSSRPVRGPPPPDRYQFRTRYGRFCHPETEPRKRPVYAHSYPDLPNHFGDSAQNNPKLPHSFVQKCIIPTSASRWHATH